MFFDTELVTRPPAAVIRSVACSRDQFGSVPVSTSVLPASGPSDGAGPSSCEAQAGLAQIVDQSAHALVLQLLR